MQRFDPLVKMFLYVLLYVVYRLVRAVVQLESDVLALTRRLILNEQQPVEIFTILTRFRLDTNDIPRDSDFMLFNEGFATFEEICDYRWHIYFISDRYVYLVQGAEGETGHVLDAPNQTRWLHSKGEKVARIAVDEFITKAAHLAPLKSKIVFLHSLPACGGILAAQLLQTADASLKTIEVLGEPPVLTTLSILSYSIPIEKMRAITRAALRLAFLNFERGQTVVFKAKSCCSKIIPYIHHSYPSIQHVFITTRDSMDCVERLVEDSASNMNVLDTVCRFSAYSPCVCDYFFGWRQSELEAVTNVGPTTPFEFALALIMGANISHQRNLKYFALDPIYFEDLLNDVHNVLRPLMDICDISDLALHECISFKRREDTAFRRFSSVHSLPDDVLERLKHISDLLQQEWNR